MKHYETVEIPSTTRQKLIRTTCDLCSEEIVRGSFDAENVEVWHKKGDAFPECGMGTLLNIDMCGKCFDEKLVPWLEDQGAELSTTEWDY